MHFARSSNTHFTLNNHLVVILAQHHDEHNPERRLQSTKSIRLWYHAAFPHAHYGIDINILPCLRGRQRPELPVRHLHPPAYTGLLHRRRSPPRRLHHTHVTDENYSP